MYKSSALLLTTLLATAACQPSASSDSVKTLVANPDRLKEVERLCKIDRTNMGEAVCNAASEARRQRFMGWGTPYTPSSAPSK
jgi:hypothetical protein